MRTRNFDANCIQDEDVEDYNDHHLKKSLQSLNISNNDCSLVSEIRLAKGVTNIYRVNLGNSNLAHQQIQALFDCLSRETCQLKHLVLREVDMSSLNQDVNMASLNQDVFARGSSFLTSLDVQVCRYEMQINTAKYSVSAEM